MPDPPGKDPVARTDTKDRNRVIWKERCEGKTLREIAACYDLSIARVSRICARQAEIEWKAIAEVSSGIILDGRRLR